MMKRFFIIPLLLLLFLAACGANEPATTSTQETDGPIVTVFRAPT